MFAPFLALFDIAVIYLWAIGDTYRKRGLARAAATAVAPVLLAGLLAAGMWTLVAAVYGFLKAAIVTGEPDFLLAGGMLAAMAVSTAVLPSR